MACNRTKRCVYTSCCDGKHIYIVAYVKLCLIILPCPLSFCLLQTKEKELMELSKAVNETRSRMDLSQSELDIYLSRHNTALTQLNTAKQTLQTTSDKLRERRAAIKDLEVKIPQKEQELKKVKTTLFMDSILFRKYFCTVYRVICVIVSLNCFFLFCRMRKSWQSWWRWILRLGKLWGKWGRRWMKPRAPCPPTAVEEKSWMPSCSRRTVAESLASLEDW